MPNTCRKFMVNYLHTLAWEGLFHLRWVQGVSCNYDLTSFSPLFPFPFLLGPFFEGKPEAWNGSWLRNISVFNLLHGDSFCCTSSSRMYCCCIDDTNSVLWYQSFQLVLNMASFESPIYPYIEGIVIKLLLHCNGEVFVSNICRAQNYDRSVLIHFSIKVFKRNQATNLFVLMSYMLKYF